MPVVRAVAFDFNGTLSDDEPIMYRIYRDLFAEHGRPISREQYFGRLSGHSEEEIINGWLGAEGETLAALVADRIARYRALVVDGSTVSERVRQAVRYAAERVPVALVSGAFREEIEPVLTAAGLRSCFAALVTADDVTAGKPAPDAYLELLRRLGDGRAGDVVAIEDTEAGVASAKAAGLRCVAVLGTHPRDRLAAADRVVERIDVALMSALLA
jgi:beta-phosphoglucomutase-like phosphatase (HAD superfamily)